VCVDRDERREKFYFRFRDDFGEVGVVTLAVGSAYGVRSAEGSAAEGMRGLSV